MLVKWITCVVPPTSEVEFSAAQAGWSALRAVPGLIGQVGGWDNSRTACVLAAWETRDRYETFQRDHHDPIVADCRCGRVATTISATSSAPYGHRAWPRRTGCSAACSPSSATIDTW
jgi:hypothetical protein